MGFSLLPREDEYFDLFTQITGKLQEAAGTLVEMMRGSDENFDSLSKKIKHVEHECDEITHGVTKKLNSSFITPFDREDIYTLSGALDEIPAAMCFRLARGSPRTERAVAGGNRTGNGARRTLTTRAVLDRCLAEG